MRAILVSSDSAPLSSSELLRVFGMGHPLGCDPSTIAAAREHGKRLAGSGAHMKIAVIGCGKQGQRHLQALAGLPGVTGLVTTDTDMARSRAAANRFGAEAVSLIDAVFADQGIGAVVIAAPTVAHLPLAARAVDAGKHFLCEKPFGAAAATARHIARHAAAHGVVGRVGYIYRFAPAIAAARDAIGQLGEIGDARFVIAAPGGHALWKHRRQTSGGAVNELVSHMVDLALWFFGPMRDCVVLKKSQSEVHRIIDGITAPVDAEDRIVARFQTRAGVTVTIEGDFAAPRFSQWLEISWRAELGSCLDHPCFDNILPGTVPIEDPPNLYRLQAQSFIAAIAGMEAGMACDVAAAAQASELLAQLNAVPVEAM